MRRAQREPDALGQPRELVGHEERRHREPVAGPGAAGNQVVVAVEQHLRRADGGVAFHREGDLFVVVVERELAGGHEEGSSSAPRGYPMVLNSACSVASTFIRSS